MKLEQSGFFPYEFQIIDSEGHIFTLHPFKVEMPLWQHQETHLHGSEKKAYFQVIAVSMKLSETAVMAMAISELTGYFYGIIYT